MGVVYIVVIYINNEPKHTCVYNIGWNKVDKLAGALIDTEGLGLTKPQASLIKECFDNLDDYDRKPLTYEPVVKRLLKGKFSNTKSSRSGHISITAMRR